MHNDFLDRYQSGHYEQVWEELLALGPAIRSEPLLSQARAVTTEMMRRIRHNLELLVPRLRSLGYRFVSELPRQTISPASIWDSVMNQAKAQYGDAMPPEFFATIDHMKDDMVDRFAAMQNQMQEQAQQWWGANSPPPHLPTDPIWRRPDATLQQQLAEVEATFGPVPLALALWFEIVGEVDLCGVHPQLSRYESHAPKEQQGPISDPLCVACMPVDEFDAYDDEAEDEEVEIFPALEIAPDALHKSNISGGGPMAIRLPNAAIDAPLISDDSWDGMYFVPYLRRCFAYGGFPGLHGDPEALQQANEVLAVLTADLLPF